MPHPEAEPSSLPVFLRVVPLDAQDTSYLAASASVLSFSRIISFIFLKGSAFPF
jgi:hypothetical protein